MTANTYNQAPSMTGARQTMMSWARVVETLDQVPVLYRESFEKLVNPTGDFPYTVFAPAQSNSRGTTSIEKLILDTDDTLYVLEKAGAKVSTIGFHYDDLYSFQAGNILLYSWFSVVGKTTDGKEATTSVQYNESTLRVFEPFFKKMRPLPEDPAPGAETEAEKLDYLESENFKFSNFARKSLIRGEKIIQSLYQPPKLSQIDKLFGRSFFRSVFLAHFDILTDKEVILIGEAEWAAQNAGGRYGGVQRYLPLSKIQSVSLDVSPDGLLRLTFQVSAGFNVERLFEKRLKVEVESLKKAVDELIS